MADIQVRRVPVLNRDKGLVGILSLGDIASAAVAKVPAMHCAGYSDTVGNTPRLGEDEIEPMLDLARARDRMVDVQIAGCGVREPYVLEALRRVPREAFVEPGFEAFAYEGRLTDRQKRCQIITAARRLALGDIMLGSLGGIISERSGGFIGRLKKETVEDERSCLQHHRDRRNIENQRRRCRPEWH
jgi:CBS domain-containing protein